MGSYFSANATSLIFCGPGMVICPVVSAGRESPPGKFTYCEDSTTDFENPNYLKTAKRRYDCGDVTTTAYHIFVRVPKQGEAPPK